MKKGLVNLENNELVKSAQNNAAEQIELLGAQQAWLQTARNHR